MKFTLCRDKVVVFIESLKKFATFPKDNAEFDKVYAYITQQDATEEGFLEIFIDVADKFISKYTDGDIVQEESGKATLNGLEIPENILTKINELRKAGFSWQQHQKFWARCLLNPRRESIVDLFRFIDKHDLIITEEGTFLGYKAITRDFKDKYTGLISNRIGETVTMKREDVTFDPNEACSHGLHVACYDYAKNYMDAYNGDKLVIVEVDPRDVVSVPYDCDSKKIRVCKYKVVKEVIPDEPALNTGVVKVDSDAHEVATVTADELKDIGAGKTWTEVEKATLNTICMKAIASSGKINWSVTSKLLPGRSEGACKKMWSKIKAEKVLEPVEDVPVRRTHVKAPVVKRSIPAPKVPNRTGREWGEKSEKNLCRAFMEWCGRVKDFYRYYAKKCGRTPKAVARKLEGLLKKQHDQFNGLL